MEISKETDKEHMDANDEAQIDELRFSSDEESALLDQSNEQKLHANALFGSARYSEAIQQYDKALSFCPNYLEYEVAVLRSNIAACHIKLEDWKSAVDAADASLEALDRLETQDRGPSSKEKDKSEARDEDEEGVEDIISPGAKKAAPAFTQKTGRKEAISRIRAKALMRRAKARTESGGWNALAGAQEDYRALTKMPNLSLQDRRLVDQQLRSLPSRIDAAKQNEVGEMMGKLKELGNGLLKPFGLSTDNFNMVKDEGSGGYSMQFNQGN